MKWLTGIAATPILALGLVLNLTLSLTLGLGGCTDPDASGSTDPGNPSTRGQFLQYAVGSPANRRHALKWIDAHWQPGFEAMAIDAMQFSGSAESRQLMVDLLEKKTDQSFGLDTDAWRRWLWQNGGEPHPQYSEVKATLIGMVDNNYRAYFLNSPDSEIRLDEVQWLGLRRSDDLSPLNSPDMVTAAQSPLADAQKIFGVLLDDQARAYASGIVQQHGVVVDSVGGNQFMLVDDNVGGGAAAWLLGEQGQRLANSGFLHRGDNLLYDDQTKSLWSSLRGRPVVGPLVGQNIHLQSLPAVATTWGEWRRRHPRSKVTANNPTDQKYLSGQASYRAFVAEDRLLRGAAGDNIAPDTRVLGLTRDDAALAIPFAVLQRKPVLTRKLGGESVAILTRSRAGSRAYLTEDVDIVRWLDSDRVVDSGGKPWQVTESALVNTDGRQLARLPARRARWDAWSGAYSQSALLQP